MTVPGTPPQRRKWLILAVLSASLFMGGMDMTIVNIALPAITRDFSATAAQTVWIVNSYTLTIAALLISAGIVGDRFGRKRTLLLGLGLFAVGSVVGGLSSSPLAMIAGRALQGVGAAAMMVTTATLVRVTFSDRRERSIAVGVWTASASLGAALGPVVAGVLVENFHWESVFFVNVVLAATTFVGALLVVPESKAPNVRRLDALSMISCVLGVGGVSYFVQITAEERALHTGPTVVGVVATAWLAAFVLRQWRLDQPLLDLKLFRRAGFAVSTFVIVVSWGSLTGFIFLLTQQLQLNAGYPPLQAGLVLVPLALANSLGAVVAPYVQRHTGSRFLLVAGLCLAATSFAAVAAMGPERGLWAVLGVGLSIGVIATVGSDVMLGSAPAPQAGEAGAIQETAFALGSGFGVGILGVLTTIGYRVYFHAPAGLPPNLDRELSLSFVQARTVAMREMQLAQRIQESATLAFGDAFRLTTMVIAGALAVVAVVGWFTFDDAGGAGT